MSLEQKYYDKKLIFICSPFSGDTETNTANARRYCQYVLDHGAVPFAPHLYFPQFLDYTDEEQRKTAIGAWLVILAECDELWAFGDRLTDDMRLELKTADAFAIPMRFFSNDCKGGICLDD